MRRYLAYGFVLLYLAAMVRPIGPLMEYVIYEDYIAEFLCVNKDFKELDCNGKCYLMQRLSDQNEQKKENLPPIALEEYPIGFVEILTVSYNSTGTSITPAQKDYCNHYSFLFEYYSFHPPSV